MSAKWRRSQAWDDANIPRWAWPAKVLLRAFSSIALAVILLVFVAMYGVVASVPIGILAKAPTYLVYLATIVLAMGVAGGLPALVWMKTVGKRGRGVRFVGSFVLGIAGAAAGAWVWYREAWPALHYDPATGKGLMFFADFVARTSAITLRRLPGVEMSELEFYGWWPLRLALMLFVLNMIVATVRRIEFGFKTIGVLTVHTGIVTIALGSVYYNGLKQEGDTILRAGAPDPKTGDLTPGPAQRYFYDNTRVSLYVRQTSPRLGEAEQRPLEGVPRYNDYGLNALGGESAWESAGVRRASGAGADRALSIDVQPSPLGRVDPDINFRVVGYASYAEATEDWTRIDPADVGGLAPGQRLNPLRMVDLLSAVPDEKGEVPAGPVFVYALAPRIPTERSSIHSMLAVEYTTGGDGPAQGVGSGGMPESRWRDLGEKLPDGASYGLVVEIPRPTGDPFRAVYPIRQGDRLEIRPDGAAGSSLWNVAVDQLSPEPPFPIITEGYRNASSSVAVLKITPPADSAAGGGKPFERWVYHRFPEIAQDLLEEKNERGMPKRQAANPAVRFGLIEADRLNVYFDEPAPGHVRAIVREPRGGVRVIDRLEGDQIGEVVPKIGMRIRSKWDHAERIERPVPVAEDKRDREAVGTHDKAMLAVEVSTRGKGSESGAAWRRVVWLPFTRYISLAEDVQRNVQLPDGRTVELSWGRRQRRFPTFELRLTDFKMLAYDHRGSPRDYQSTVHVEPLSAPGQPEPFEAYTHVTQLNEPLRAPFMWNEHRNLFTNIAGTLARGISPLHFKLSQAGWDRGNWERTQQMADAGEVPKPFVTFTILGVGNNPGIHLIALGAVMMGVGIPWAFYLKPYLVRREKRKIQQALAAGTYVKPERPARNERAGEGTTAPAEPAGVTAAESVSGRV